VGEGRAQLYYQQFVDEDGCPLAGAKVYHYRAGTTTDLDVWADPSKTTTLAQPATADGAGRVKFYGDGDYRLAIQYSDGTFYDELDDIRITRDTSLVWENSHGATLPAGDALNKWQLFLQHDATDNITGLFTWDGSQWLDLAGRVNDNVFNVKTYGALGDGSADDTVPLQNALTAALAAGGCVYMPAGVYLYSDLAFDITGPVCIRGQGTRQTFLRPTGGYTDFAIQVSDTWRKGTGFEAALRDGTLFFQDDLVSPKPSSGVLLTDFAIVGDRDEGTQRGIRTFDRVDFLTMQRVDMMFLNGQGLEIGKAGTEPLCRESQFWDVRIAGCGNLAGSLWPVHITTGVGAGDGTNQLSFVNCEFVANHAPVRIDNETGLTTKDTRRIRFTNLMLHGQNAGTFAYAGDIMVINGLVRDLVGLNISTNGSHDVGGTKYGCIRIEDDAAGNTPARIELYGWNVRNAAGHGLIVDQVESLRVHGNANTPTILGNEAVFGTSSITARAIYDVLPQGGSSVSIDSSVDGLVGSHFTDREATPVIADFISTTLGANKPRIRFAVATDEDSVDQDTGSPEAVLSGRVGDFLIVANQGGLRSAAAFWVKNSGTNTNEGWLPVSASGVVATTAQLQDVGDQINILGKVRGKMVWNATLGKPYWADQSAATSTWSDATGGGALTPV